VTRFFLRIVKPRMHVVSRKRGLLHTPGVPARRPGWQGHAVESNPADAVLARRSLSVNGFLTRARMIEMTVTDAPGIATLYCLELRQGDSSISYFSEDSSQAIG
jgi:hypothetical protein